VCRRIDVWMNVWSGWNEVIAAAKYWCWRQQVVTAILVAGGKSDSQNYI
jgi:hypothetical protein